MLCTVSFMHLGNPGLKTTTLDEIVIVLKPIGQRGQPGPRELFERTEEQAIEGRGGSIDDEDA